jgi:hypothetical protein
MTSSRLIVWGLVCVSCIAAAFEGTIRVDDWAQHGVPLSSGYTSLGQLIIRDSLGMHPRPNSQFRQFRVNSLGYRGDEWADTARAQPRVVLTMGASETFGLYESAGKEWPRQLQDSLTTTCPMPVRVLNGAFAGMSLPTVTADLLARGRALRPRVVVYYPTPVQYLESVALPSAPAPSADFAPPPPWWWLRGPSRLRDGVKASVPQVVLDILRRVDAADAKSPVIFPIVPEDRLDAFDADLRRLVGASRAIGATPVLIAHRHRLSDTLSAENRRWLRAWSRFYPLATGAVILDFESRAIDRIRLVARDSAVAFVDPAARLSATGPAAFADFSHFTDRGAAAMAGATVGAAAAAAGCDPGD